MWSHVACIVPLKAKRARREVNVGAGSSTGWWPDSSGWLSQPSSRMESAHECAAGEITLVCYNWLICEEISQAAAHVTYEAT